MALPIKGGGDDPVMEPAEEIRRFWDADAATYDRSAAHHPTSALEQAAWSGVLARLLPPAPARVLDVGAGTGFLSLLAARLDHRVTAVDVSGEMLAQLRDKAQTEDLDLEIVEGPAEEPPTGPFDAVVERHVVWTLPDPAAALEAWRSVAPSGRLVLLESAWGSGGGATERLRERVHVAAGRLRGDPPEHHADYAPDLLAALPYANNFTPEQLVELVESTAWGPARLERLRDVDWAIAQARSAVERLLGVTPRYAVVAG